MRSYEAARTYFSILEVVSKIIIIIGGIVALISLLALGEMSRDWGGSPLAGLVGIVPGVIVMFAGFLGMVVVQIGRAGVDTAEYTQQMLKIARDQLEVSQQALRGPNASARSFADAVAETPGASATFENLGAANGEAEANGSPAPAVENDEHQPHSPDAIEQQPLTAYQIGRQVVQTIYTAKQGLVAAAAPTEGDVPLEWKTEKRES